MIDPAPAVHHWVWWHSLISGLSAVGGWEGLRATARQIIGAMPPLPADANWWETWLYRSLQAVGGPGAAPKMVAPSESKP